jgi:SAM-dependent methyltransferase
MRELACAVCRGNDYRVRYPPQIPAREALDFSARRHPQKYHARIVECRRCGLVYSNPYFDDDVLRPLYQHAAYIDEAQLANMSEEYLREFVAAAPVDRAARILEIGCANGFFLDRLSRAGFTNVHGVEPGRDAARNAPPSVRDRILNDFFEPGRLSIGPFDVVCCFQLFDHLPDPNQFLQDVASVLAPGGLVVAINHNVRAPITRLLGERSPMYDIEHIFLFDKQTIRRLFEANGFDVTRVADLRNAYTLGYAVKMFPFPAWLKHGLQRTLRAVSLAHRSLRVPAGNMLTVARKRRTGQS